MDSDLFELRARVDRLERALRVAESRHVGRPRIAAPSILLIAAAAALVGTIVGAPIPMRAAGPTKVTAPFAVVDASGRALMEVQSEAGGGRLVVYNSAQDRVAEIQASDNGAAGRVRVYLAGESKPKVMLGVNVGDDTGGLELAGVDGGLAQMSGKGVVVADGNRHPVAALLQKMDSGWMKLWGDGLPRLEAWSGSPGGRLTIYGSSGGDSSGGGDSATTAGEAVTIEGQTGGAGKMTFLANGKPRTSLGVSADDAGLIRLEGASGNSVEMHGANGSFKSLNSEHREVFDVGVDGNGNGVLDVRHRAGVGGVRLDVSDTGAGNLKIHTPPFEIKAQIGTKGEKGDVCVEGGKGLICLSGVAIKSFIPW